MSRSDLSGFPRPSVAVDVAVLTLMAVAGERDRTRLAMLVWRRTGRTAAGQWALPGSFVRERERLVAAVTRTLRDKCAVSGLAPRQLGVLDDPERDDRGWVLSVAFSDVVPAAALLGRAADDRVTLATVRSDVVDTGGGRRSVLDLPDRQRRLPFDHERIARLAVGDLRDRYRDRPDPARLVEAPFTMRRLRLVHEAVLGRPLNKDTFRRAVAPHLRELDTVQEGTVGRPARLYRHV